MIDLQEHCHKTRVDWQSKPFRIGDRLVATDGNHLVAVPDDGSEIEKVVLRPVIEEQIKSWLIQKGESVEVLLSDLRKFVGKISDRVPCAICEGRLRVECEECNGSRNRVCPECDGGEYVSEGDTCEICHNTGQVECLDCESDGKYECEDCEEGLQDPPIRPGWVGDRCFNLNVLALALKVFPQELPDNIRRFDVKATPWRVNVLFIPNAGEDKALRVDLGKTVVLVMPLRDREDFADAPKFPVNPGPVISKKGEV